MLFNAEAGSLFGITANCYKSFGIPSSLIYGNSQYTNEFTMDTIIPELMNIENVEKLKSSKGILLSLDTTMIQQNFLIAQGQSDRDSDGSKREEGDQYMFAFLIFELI